MVTSVMMFVKEAVCTSRLFIALVGMAETNSEHPLGTAVVNYAKLVSRGTGLLLLGHSIVARESELMVLINSLHWTRCTCNCCTLHYTCCEERRERRKGRKERDKEKEGERGRGRERERVCDHYQFYTTLVHVDAW